MEFLDWLKVLVLGIVEGITEWLPISSTGHMVLVDALWPSANEVMTEDFMTMFEVVIQFGAILAVILLYFKKLWPFRKKDKTVRGPLAYCNKSKFILWLKIAVSCVPAILIGLPLDDWMEAHLFTPVVVASMLILYGVAFL